MNKNQTILAAIGGVTLLGSLVLGYFIWDASGSRSESEDTLESGLSNAKGVMKKLPVRAEKAELKVYTDNAAAFDDWRAEAAKIAARGDLVFDATTPADFKTTLVAEARRLADKPGCIGGKFVKTDFGFGFNDYVTGGAMPPEKDLKRLQREWNDVSSVLATLADCGGANIGITAVTLGKAKAAVAPEPEAAPTKAKGKAKSRAKPKPKAKKVEEDAETSGPAVTSFTVEFMTRPAALVKALNAFTTGTRFVVVENCTFVRERDGLAETLGGDAKGTETAAPRRRGRNRAAAAEETAKSEVKSGIVTDPLTAPMIKVSMAISVYDFGTLEKAKEELQ